MTHPLGKAVCHTCSDFFKSGQNFHTYSHLFHICSHLFTPFHTCSQLFTPVHNCSHLSDYLRSLRNGSFSLNFPLAKAVIFLILRAILLKLNVFAHLFVSYPTVHGLSSCIKIKLLIPMAAHTTVTMYIRRTMSFFALWISLILRSYVLSC